MDVVFLFVLWSCRCPCMGSMSVLSCICCMFVSCVHPAAVLMKFVNAGQGWKRHTPESVS